MTKIVEFPAYDPGLWEAEVDMHGPAIERAVALDLLQRAPDPAHPLAEYLRARFEIANDA